MTKVVYSACYGGYGLSQKALKLYLELDGSPHEIMEDPNQRSSSFPSSNYMINGEYVNSHPPLDILMRVDPRVVKVVETLGSVEAGSSFADLQVIDIPEGTYYRITEYDGFEDIEYRDDVYWKIA